MIKHDGVDIPRIEYIDPVDGKVSILRVMQDGVQIWPSDAEPLQIPTGIILREVIPTSIEWDYFTTYTVTTNTEVRAYLKDDIILPFTGGDYTQFGLKVNGSPVVFTNFGIHYAPGQSYVTLRNPTDFLPTDVITFSYTAGADPIEGENTGTFAPDLVDQLVQNTIEDEGKPNIPTGIQLGEYDIIDWDFTQFEAGVNDNNTLVGMVVKDGILDMSSVPDETDFEVKINGSPVTPTGLSMSTTYIRLTVAKFGASDVLTVSYTPGIDPVKGDDGVLLSSLIDQTLTNILEPLQIPTGITLRELAPYTYLLDDYPGAAAAYSLRKLRTGVVQGIMVRRDSDDQFIDVRLYDDPNKSIDLDSITESGGQTLGEWVGSASAFVFNWYDQSGSGNHASQLTEANQPRIVNAGVLETNRPLFDGVNDVLTVSSNSSLQITGDMSTFAVSRLTGVDDVRNTIYQKRINDNDREFEHRVEPTLIRYLDDANSLGQLDTVNINETKLYGFDRVANTSVTQHLNGTPFTQDALTGTLTTSTAPLSIGGRHDVDGFNWYGNIQEVILYPSDQSANRTAIETNINEFYNIY